jgi:Tfp pilus assembly major pilin PilA
MKTTLSAQEKAKGRYEVLRTLLMASLVVVVLLALLFSIYQNSVVRSGQKDSQALIAAVTEEAKKSAARDLDREADFDRAVEQIAAEQYRAMVAHDGRMRLTLKDAMALLNAEVNAPANREQRPHSISPFPARQPTTVAPRPAPAPTCQARGNSGKCK